MRLRFTILIMMLMAALLSLGGCAPSSGEMKMPYYVNQSSPEVQQAYDYAHHHPDELVNYPCYCGCNSLGHENNLDCYIQHIDAEGKVTWDGHAAACTICVEITLDVERLKAKGWSSQEIRAYIDDTYSQYGPGTDTPFPTQ